MKSLFCPHSLRSKNRRDFSIVLHNQSALSNKRTKKDPDDKVIDRQATLCTVESILNDGPVCLWCVCVKFKSISFIKANVASPTGIVRKMVFDINKHSFEID